MNFGIKFGKEYAKKVHDDEHGWYYGREYYGTLLINGVVELNYEYDTSNRRSILIYGRGVYEFGRLTKRDDGTIDAKEDIKRMVLTNEVIKSHVEQKMLEKLGYFYDNLISKSDSFD